MFQIENLLDLFTDEQVQEVIINSYLLSQTKDKVASDMFFYQLLYIKSVDPDFNIIIDPTSDNSYFSFFANKIVLNNQSTGVFFHELTHLLSYSFSQFQVPDEYYTFKQSIQSTEGYIGLMVDLLNLCAQQKKQLNIDSLDRKEEETDITSIEEKKKIPYIQNPECDTINMIEDIVDSILDGRAFTDGLTYEKDIFHLPTRSKKASGHGCEYFSKNGYQFEEILANYQAIKLTDPDNELFILLKKIMGKEFVSFLDKRCQDMRGQIAIDKDIDTMNNNKGKR